MIIMAIDCSAAACSVALVEGSEPPLFFEHMPMMRGHAEALAPMMQRGLSAVEAERTLYGPEEFAIAVSIGPGAFTGIRIAMAAAQGLALTRKAPLIGVTRFEALSEALSNQAESNSEFQGEPLHIHAVLETKRQDFYVQDISAIGPIGAAKAMQQDALTHHINATIRTQVSQKHAGGFPKAILCGDGANRYVSEAPQEHTSSLSILPLEETAEWVARAGNRLFTAPSYNPSVLPQPFYLRDADTGSKQA